MNQQDLRLDDIDFKWVENCDSQVLLKQAIQLIEDDGNYYPDLKKTIQNKLQQLQPNYSKKNKTTQISKEEKNYILNDLEKWAQNLPKQPVSDIQKHEAENFKIKGDEALKSGDYEESINFYQKAISKNPKNELIYGNQAFAFTQLKKFKEAVQSATQSIKINQKYVKAYYRRAKANEALKNFLNAYSDVLEILRLEPTNSVAQKLKIQYEKNIPQDQIKNLQEQSQQNQDTKQQKNGKIKIKIEEQSDESDEEIEDKVQVQIIKKKQQCADYIQKGNFQQAINLFESYVRKESIQNKYDELWVSSMCNLSHCHKQQHDDDSVIAVCDEIIDYFQNKTNKPESKLMNMLVKSILRKAFSLERKEKLKFALENFLLAQKFQPFNPQVNQGVQRNLQIIKGYDNLFDINKLKKRVNIKFNQFKSNNQSQNNQTSNVKQEMDIEYKVIKQQTKDKDKTQVIKTDNNKNMSGIELDRLIQLKNEGNQNFKQKNLKKAIELYTKAIKVFNKNLQDKELNLSNQKVLVDLLSNRSLSYYYYKQYNKGIIDIKRVLNLTPENQKAIYRLTLNYEGQTEELFTKASQVIDNKTKLDFYNQCIQNAHQTIKYAQSILNKENNEKLKNSQNKANDILKQCEQKIIKLQQQNIDQKEQKIKTDKKDSQQSIVNNQQNETQKNNIKKPQQKLSKDFELKAQKIAQQSRLNLLENYKEPSTSSQFETELKSFGNQNDLAYQYLVKTSDQLIQKFYQSTQLEAQNLLKIFKIFEANLEKKLNQDDTHKIFRICQILPNGKKFKLSIMMLSKKEKQIIQKVIEFVGKRLSLKEEDLSKLKQLYKIKQFL